MFDLSNLFEKATGLLGDSNAAAFLEKTDPAEILDQIGVDPAMLEQIGLDPAALTNMADLDVSSLKDFIGQSRP